RKEGKIRMDGIGEGDAIRATGIANQFAKSPPYIQKFELLAPNKEAVAVVQRHWSVSPILAVGALAIMLGAGLLVWARERWLRDQRELLRKTYQLGEEILGAASPAAILERLRNSLPQILGVTRVHLYVYNRAAKTLDAVPVEGEGPESISLSAPPGGTQ